MNSTLGFKMKPNNAPALAPWSKFAASFVASSRYWIWAGILDAWNRAKRIKPDGAEFYIPFLTMLMGVALLWPGEISTPTSGFLRLWMSESFWGAVFLVVGRYAIHSMLHPSRSFRCWAMGVLMFCWVFLAMVTISTAGVSLGAFTFAFIAAWAGILLKDACRTPY